MRCLLQHRDDRHNPAVAAQVEPEAAAPALPDLPAKQAGTHRVAIASSDGKVKHMQPIMLFWKCVRTKSGKLWQGFHYAA